MYSKFSLLVVSLFILCLFNACSLEKQRVHRTYKNFKKALDNQKGKTVYDLSDEESHLYFQQLLRKTQTLDSLGVIRQPDFNQMNIIMARGFLSDSMLVNSTPKEFMIALYNFRSFDLLHQMIQRQQFDISWMSVKNNKATVHLENDDVIYFNKENDSWKINMPTLMKLSDEHLKEAMRIATSNGLDKNESLDRFAKSKVGHDLIKPIDYLYSPIGVKENELFLNGIHFFSKTLDCDEQVNVNRAHSQKVVFFVDRSRLATDFYLKFVQSQKFKSYANKNFDFILLSNYCKVGKRLFDKYNIRNIPTILTLNEAGEIQNKSLGYFITPDMFLESIHVNGEVVSNFDKSLDN